MKCVYKTSLRLEIQHIVPTFGIQLIADQGPTITYILDPV